MTEKKPVVTLEKQLISTPEAAAILGLKPETLEIWRWRGCGPRFIKLNRAVRYHVEDINTFVQAGFRKNTS